VLEKLLDELVEGLLPELLQDLPGLLEAFPRYALNKEAALAQVWIKAAGY